MAGLPHRVMQDEVHESFVIPAGSSASFDPKILREHSDLLRNSLRLHDRDQHMVRVDLGYVERTAKMSPTGECVTILLYMKTPPSSIHLDSYPLRRPLNRILSL